jgi:hypothetical protein
MESETREIFSYVLTGTKHQLDEMKELLNYENYYDKKITKYFHVWKHYGTGIFYFPKEKYFKAKKFSDGTYETNYVAALFRYGTNVNILDYDFMKQ